LRSVPREASSSSVSSISTHEESARLFNILLWAFLTAVPLTAVLVSVGFSAGSSALLALGTQYVVFIIVTVFSLYALRRVIKDNTFALPWGAGKLENFSSFISSFSYLPFAAYFLYTSGRDLLAPEPVNYAATLAPVGLSLARVLLLDVQARRLVRRIANPSPLVISYVIDFRLSVWNDAGVVVSLGIGLLLVKLGFARVGDRIDALVAIVVALRMAWFGIRELRKDLAALLDLPLPEKQQLAIMRVLAKHYADYDSIGALYTRISGKRRLVELELGFSDEQTVGHVNCLARNMELDLSQELPDLDFRIVAVLADEVH
jgi:divalent metal cation (Fe/Co/Zn/Cd) transporter